jgi:hypothetical protein
MKIKPTNNKKYNGSSSSSKESSSLSAKVEQVAKLLRAHANPKPVKSREATVLSPTNTIEQVAKLFRSEIHKELKRIAKKK